MNYFIELASMNRERARGITMTLKRSERALHNLAWFVL